VPISACRWRHFKANRCRKFFPEHTYTRIVGTVWCRIYNSHCSQHAKGSLTLQDALHIWTPRLPMEHVTHCCCFLRHQLNARDVGINNGFVTRTLLECRKWTQCGRVVTYPNISSPNICSGFWRNVVSLGGFNLVCIRLIISLTLHEVQIEILSKAVRCMQHWCMT
jgi:hypothetical protein